MTKLLCGIALLGICVSCLDSQAPGVGFTAPVKISITGYTGNSMEPFLTRDGTILLFNNLNSMPENTNLHWATKVNDSTFSYQGELTGGVNTPTLEGVPTMDQSGNLFFVSDRDYASTLSSIFTGSFSAGIVSGIQPVPNISKNQVGWLNFDVEVSASGMTLYTVDGRFDQNGGPYESDFIIATKVGSSFVRSPDSANLLKNVNSVALEYAACISKDELELYFTRVDAPLTASSIPQIFRSTRESITEPFSLPSLVPSITGFVEAPTLSPDGKIIYYHKRENNKFVIYMVRVK